MTDSRRREHLKLEFVGKRRVWSTAYTEAADRRSTLSMLSLFAEVWPDYPQYAVESNACGTALGQAVVSAAKL